MIHHASLPVASLTRSAALYDAALVRSAIAACSTLPASRATASRKEWTSWPSRRERPGRFSARTTVHHLLEGDRVEAARFDPRGISGLAASRVVQWLRMAGATG